MSKLFPTIRRFLTAEEVPRWFGLSMVLIYIVGLGAVSQFGIRRARRESNDYFEQSTNYAVRLLAERLSAESDTDASETVWIGTCTRELRDFASSIPVRSARVVVNGRVVASSRASDTSTSKSPATVPSSGLSDADGATSNGDRAIRFPLKLHRWASDSAENDGNATDTPSYQHNAQVAGSKEVDASLRPRLEVISPAELPATDGLVTDAGAMVIALVVMGALFVIYRCLREQLRGMSRIAHRLKSRRDLQSEIASLRIADTLDGVTSGWNELVDLTEKLIETVKRTEANDELTRVLQRSGTGTLVDACNALPDGLLIITDELRFEFVNAAALRLFQWTTHQIKQTTLLDIKSEGVGAKLLEFIRSARTSDGAFESRAEIVEGSEAPGRDADSYRVWIIPLQRNNQAGDCVVMIRDASQQIRSERAREEFITQVTHELRTPLTNIRAYAETLSSGMFEDPKVITECYNVITKETRRLSRLIEDILSVAQLEVGSIELRIDSVDLRTLLSDGIRDVRGLADDKNIDIQIVLPSKLEPIRGDRDKLAVVVNNLLGNAIKYTPANGNVIVGCQVTAEAAVITVKDNGIGISPTDQARVFEKFQRGNNPEVQKESGTGIGLYTAREIVRRHGGNIELISELQKGSTFLVRLPLPEGRSNSMSMVKEGAARG
ncbi:MAG: PAS domain-containing protein [Planctomycetes bacterium]|nr:PAS domain-containing protein [Planctomycetota bacterium]MBI3832775.1 PAS domain-containing protein [Planctomycetota bacterium]